MDAPADLYDWKDLREALAQGIDLVDCADFIARSLRIHLGQDWLAKYRQRVKCCWPTAQLARHLTPQRYELLDLALSFCLLHDQSGMHSLLKQIRSNPSAIDQAGIQIRLARLEFCRSGEVIVEASAEEGTWKPDVILKVEGERAMRVECRKLSIGTKALEVLKHQKQPFDPWTRIRDALRNKAAQASQDYGWICVELDDGSFGPNQWMESTYVGMPFEEVAADLFLKAGQYLKELPAIAGVVLVTRPFIDPAPNSVDSVSTVSIAECQASLSKISGCRVSKTFVIPANRGQAAQVTAWHDLFSLDPSWTEWAREAVVGSCSDGL